MNSEIGLCGKEEKQKTDVFRAVHLFQHILSKQEPRAVVVSRLFQGFLPLVVNLYFLF